MRRCRRRACAQLFDCRSVPSFSATYPKIALYPLHLYRLAGGGKSWKEFRRGQDQIIREAGSR
jgi:hypothetical protein